MGPSLQYVERWPHALRHHRSCHEIFRWCAVLFLLHRQGPQPEKCCHLKYQRQKPPDHPLPLAIVYCTASPIFMPKAGGLIFSFSSASCLLELWVQQCKVVGRGYKLTLGAHCNDSVISIHDSMRMPAYIFIYHQYQPSEENKMLAIF